MKRTLSKFRSVTRRSRKPRIDAERNRKLILEAAKKAFTRRGAVASLDDIARSAGVGAGTLYRHFPTREALIEAVYRSEVEKLAAAEHQFAATLAPVAAWRAWMLLLVDFIAEKRIIAPALTAIVGDPTKLYESSLTLIRAANDSLIQRAIASGNVRKDLNGLDLLQALIGASHLACGPEWQKSGRRLVDILIAGARPAKDLQ